ncbi:MAE_28990/MAE_18760 family HEPN-like nuclease [Microbulbifer sp. SSSA005]|uniref:MAE_28990/MAE_18760 family HEPN-like nuclease n=1 Tax=Microbulbifer sp. SSSA005 TaxID=3243378 RepID=UPI00403A5305
MSNLEDLLASEIDDLYSQMYKCKTIHVRYSMHEEHKIFLIKQAVLSIYAQWEGFLKKVVSLYLQEINREELTFCALHDNYISYQTDQLVKFKSSKTNFQTITKISKDLYGMYQRRVVFNTKVNTESNANLKVTNSILKKLRINCLDDDYNDSLNKLLLFRNAIAHGDYAIPVVQKDIDDFSFLVQGLASDLIVNVIESYKGRVYLQGVGA